MRRACRSLGIATSGALPDPYPELLESGKGTYARKALSMRPVEPVGRASEVAALSEALDALGHGAPGCLAAEGDAGIGKTFLLHELRRLAEQRGHLVLTGSASEFERDLRAARDRSPRSQKGSAILFRSVARLMTERAAARPNASREPHQCD